MEPKGKKTSKKRPEKYFQLPEKVETISWGDSAALAAKLKGTNVVQLVDEQLQSCRALLRDPGVQELCVLEPSETPKHRAVRMMLALKADIRALHKRRSGTFHDTKLLEMTLSQTPTENDPEEALLSSLLELLNRREHLLTDLAKHLLENKMKNDAKSGIASRETVATHGVSVDADDMDHTCSEDLRLALHVFDHCETTQRVVANLVKVPQKKPPLLENLFDNVVPSIAKPPPPQQRERVELTPTELKDFKCRTLADERERLEREGARLASENGRMKDTITRLQMELSKAETFAKTEIESVLPRVRDAETKSAEMHDKVKKQTLNVDLMSSFVRENVEKAAQLNKRLATKHETDRKLAEALDVAMADLKKMEDLAERRGRIAKVAIVAKNELHNRNTGLKGEIEALLKKQDDLLDHSLARQAIVDVLAAIKSAEDADALALQNELEAYQNKIADLQAHDRTREQELTALNKRFSAMYSTGITPEKQLAFADLERRYSHTKDLLKQEQIKVTDLEAKVFELQLAVGAQPDSGAPTPAGASDDDDDDALSEADY